MSIVPPEQTSESIDQLGPRARRASYQVMGLPAATRNQTLVELSRLLATQTQQILEANARDIAAAERAGVSGPKLKRLGLSAESVASLAAGVRAVAGQPDPLAGVTRQWRSPSDLIVEKVRTPLGVIAMIYEARPGVTVDAFALCFKAGNACILKGGREAAETNTVLLTLIRRALGQFGVTADAVQLVTSTDREQLKVLLADRGNIDLVIPRGGEELIRFVAEHSRIPTLQHFKGVCHVYVHAAADLDMAERICVTGKTSSPATCNATECVLVDGGIAEQFVPRLVAAYRAAGVQIRGDAEVCRLGGDAVEPAGEQDFGCEFLDLVVAMKVVGGKFGTGGMEQAIEHIQRYTSDHTEAIVTADPAAAETFVRAIRSSCVLVNASTRNNDGGALGLGAEIGISTSRLHAYGPMGVQELTIERFVVRGQGQCR